MKILNISRPDNKASGVFAYTLNQELRNRGHESCLLVRDGLTELDGGVIGLYHPLELKIRRLMAKVGVQIEKRTPKKLKWILRHYERIDSKYCPQSLGEIGTTVSSKNLLNKLSFQPDVIILYFIDDFINAKTIKMISKATGAKIIWFLPDMAAMTGGCHYAWDCDGYKEVCGYCPAILSQDPEDITRKNMLFKQAHLEGLDLTILVASEQLSRQVVSSSLFQNHSIEHVMIPIDEEQYKPGDKSAAQQHFGVPENKKVIFIGIRSILEKRKGIKYLLDSLLKLKTLIKNSPLDETIHLLIAGNGLEDCIASELVFNYTYVGLLSVTHGLPEAFRAADVFVCPSIEDSGPMMINQSIMSGTPVVAFEMGVALDLVHTGKTGYRAKLKDSSDFAQGIKEILSLPLDGLEKMSENCREYGLSRGTVSVQVDRIESIL